MICLRSNAIDNLFKKVQLAMIKCLDKGSDIIDNPDLAKKVDLSQISNVTDNLAKKFSHLKSDATD